MASHFTVDGLKVDMDQVDWFYEFSTMLLAYLQKLPPSDGGLKLYIAGSESSDTEFERLSNNLKIGVLASSDKVGYTLLHLLHAIIDDSITTLVTTIDDYMEKPYMSVKEVADIFEKVVIATRATGVFGLTDKIEVELLCRRFSRRKEKVIRTTKVIKTTLEQVDIWTLSRFAKYEGF